MNSKETKLKNTYIMVKNFLNSKKKNTMKNHILHNTTHSLEVVCMTMIIIINNFFRNILSKN